MLQKCCLAVAVVAFFVSGCVPKGERKAADKEQDRSMMAYLQNIDLADTQKCDTINFGVIKTGEVVSRRLVLSNGGASPVVITGTQTSCGCLRLDYPVGAIAAGEKVVAEMWFDSAGYTFWMPRAFEVEGTMAKGPKKIIIVAEME